MARVTVEDCMDKVLDRFELVLVAAQRAKDINDGATVTIDNESKLKKDKGPVIALKEISLGHVNASHLKEQLIRNLQTKNKIDLIDDENIQLDKEDESEKFDYLPGGTDIHISEDHSDLDDHSFESEAIDNDGEELE